MNKNRRYILIITIVVSVCLSFYSIAQSFLTQMNQNEIKGALPLMVPTTILIIPIIIVLGISVKRELKYRKTLANGVKSAGIIKKVTETGKYIGKLPEIKLDLDVLDDKESEFQGEVITAVRKEELEFLKVGEPVPVIYKINNRNEISIDRKPDVNKLRDKIAEHKAKNNIG